MGAYIVLYPHARVYVLFRLVIPIPLPIPALWMLGVWVAMQVFYLVDRRHQPGGLVGASRRPYRRRRCSAYR